MKKWIDAHRKLVALVVLACVYAAGMALFVTWGRPLDETLISAAIWFVFTVFAWYLDARRQRKTAAKLADQGGLLVYIRYPDSLPGSLSGIWNMGVATLDEVRGMKFQPAVYDTLEPSGRATTFHTLTAVTEPKEIGMKDRWHVTRPGFRTIRLGSEKGDIEVAAAPESLRKILNVIRQGEETS